MKAAEELDRMLAGEQVEASEDVRELAALAALLQGAWQEGPDAASATRVRTAALSAFQEAPAAASTVPSIVRARPSGGRRLAVRMALVAALVAGLPTAAWAATEDSLPGELLYPVKRGFEEVRLVLAGDAASEAEVLLGMSEERIEEAVQALGRGLDAVVAQALVGYEDAMLRFQARIVQAQAEGLPVAPLLEEAAELEAIQDEIFEEDVAPTVIPPEAPVPPTIVSDASSKGDGGNGKAKGKGGGGGKGDAKGHRGSGGNGNGGSGGGGGGGSSSGGSGGSSGGGGTTGGGGGAGGGGGLGDGKEEDPPAPATEGDEGEDDDEGSGSGSGSGEGSGEGSGSGEGLGHEIGKGKGHDKHGDEG